VAVQPQSQVAKLRHGGAGNPQCVQSICASRRCGYSRWIILFVLIALPFIAEPLIAQDPLLPADAIVVIGGDHKPDRIARAVYLYEQGYAPIVILSAGTPVWEGDEQIAEAEVMRRQAVAVGLPPEAILMETESQTTRENAIYTRTLSEANGLDSFLLVTSTYHSRRACHLFNTVFPMGSPVTFSTQPAPRPFCSLCWFLYPDYVHTVFYVYYNWLLLGIGLYP
jgi:uncharacterized SAM-binding protein YcdF (DUF218 family)